LAPQLKRTSLGSFSTILDTAALSPIATALLAELRRWASTLPPSSVIIREHLQAGYGGLLFEVRPSLPDTMGVSIGLGSSSDIDVFWGDGYRLEDWKPQDGEVLRLCKAIRAGEVVEETWKLGGLVLEKRCYIGRDRQVGSGSGLLPAWLKRLARRSERTFRPWGEAV
jgi:hypothetical protein